MILSYLQNGRKSLNKLNSFKQNVRKCKIKQETYNLQQCLNVIP